MPYSSDAQRKYFNANRVKLEAEGVDVDEWNASSKGKRLPEKKTKAASDVELLARTAVKQYIATQEKQAISVEEGGPVGRFTASTLGRINPNSLVSLILSRNAYHDPSRNFEGTFLKKRFKRHERTARLLEKYDPEALKNTVLRLGGTDIVDDIIYAKERGEKLPWYRRIGGRVWHNPRTSIAGKLLGTVTVPIGSSLSNVTRGSNYNPFSDVATVYQHEDPIVEHELGHALDFNRVYGIRPGDEVNLSWFKSPRGTLKRVKQELKGAVRDAYMGAYAYVPYFNLLPEAQANIESQKALNYALANNPEELAKRNARRLEVLPSGYGSYVGAAFPVVGPLTGIVAGKALGLAGAKIYRSRNPAFG